MADQDTNTEVLNKPKNVVLMHTIKRRKMSYFSNPRLSAVLFIGRSQSVGLSVIKINVFIL